jgi:hypothetical protein
MLPTFPLFYRGSGCDLATDAFDAVMPDDEERFKFLRRVIDRVKQRPGDIVAVRAMLNATNEPHYNQAQHAGQ